MATHRIGFALGPTFFAAFALAVALGFGIGAAYATSSIPPNDNVVGQLTSDLNSSSVKAGDRFALNVVAPYPGGDRSYAGAVVQGHVRSVSPALPGQPARMSLAIDDIVLPSGASLPLAAHVSSGAGVGMLVGDNVGKWSERNANFIVPRGSTVRVHVDQSLVSSAGS